MGRHRARRRQRRPGDPQLDLGARGGARREGRGAGLRARQGMAHRMRRRVDARMSALDPQARAVIDLVAKSGRPAYHTLSPKDARQLFLETRPASTPTPPEIGSVRNLVTETPQGAIPLRVYRPAGVPAATALPAYVYFHRAGWVIGDLETHDVLCRQLTAASGASVISVDYRLAPEHKFPAAADDAWAATRWIVAHAADLGLDAARLAVGGDSAGGNLAAVVALLAPRPRGPGVPPPSFIF